MADFDASLPSPVGQALEYALTQQTDLAVVYLDASLRAQRVILDPVRFDGLTVPVGTTFADLSPDVERVGDALRDVLATGQPWLSSAELIRAGAGGGAQPELSVRVRAMRIETPVGRGVIVTLINVTEEQRSRHYLDLVLDAASTIGTSLDVRETAQQLADALVPGLGDAAVVYLAREVFEGAEPPRRDRGGDLRMLCAARAISGRQWPDSFIAPGEPVPVVPPTEQVLMHQRGAAGILPDRAAALGAIDSRPDVVRRMIPDHTDSPMACVFATLVTQQLILGSVQIWRIGQRSAPFDADDLNVLKEIAAQAAVKIDNARRYTREQRRVLRLQQFTLATVATVTAAETTARYLSASPHSGGPAGDWYDVAALSGRRVAFVVGDVVGHGLDAAAMMGRLRTAAWTLVSLDLAPDEVLTHLDDLVIALAEERPGAASDGQTGATCCVGVYDPVRHRLAVASAGHPAPILVMPDGTADYIALDPGPPLGVGWLPFEVAEVRDLPRGATVVWFTDGLVGGRDLNLDDGLQALREHVAGTRPHDDLGVLADRVMADAPRDDDATLLIARLQDIPDSETAAWDLPAQEAEVSTARMHVTERLAEWGAGDDLLCAAKLVVSELVTNAVRYGDGTRMGLRLIRGEGELIVEVSDSANTSPHLKQARPRDEGGRGLLIVAQLSGGHWGARHLDPGEQYAKTLWTKLSWDTAPTPVFSVDIEDLDLGDLLQSEVGIVEGP